MAVVATLSKGYDLDYIWTQVDRGPAKDAASYYLQASESGGEPPGRWSGPGALALGFTPSQLIDREPYDLLFGKRQAPMASRSAAHPPVPEAPPTYTPSCWPLNPTPLPNANANSGPKPPSEPGPARCSST